MLSNSGSGGVEAEATRGRDQARHGDENALVILDTVLALFDIEAVDDVGIGDESEAELARRCRGEDLHSPNLASEQAAE
jgi:hypothetical protein